MHRCLLVAEIAREIIEYLVEEGHSKTPRGVKFVLPVALSCKALLEPALDVLWKSQSSIRPLFKCLAGSEWKKTESYYRHISPWTLCKPIKSGDWSRLIYYGRRIRCLEGEFSSVDEAFWSLIAAWMPSIDILPNLLSLTWNVSYTSPSSLAPVRVLLGRSLRRLRLKIRAADSVYWFSVLPALPYLTPALQEFDLLYSASNQSQGTSLEAEFLHHWNDLTVVKLNGAQDLRLDTIPELSRLNSLRKLSIIGAASDGEFSSSELAPGCFSSLESMEIHSSPPWILSFLSCLKERSIKTLFIKVFDGYYFSSGTIICTDWDRLGACISRACSARTMRDITIVDSINDFVVKRASSLVHALNPSHMEFLVAFKDLEKISIRIGGRPLTGIDDNVVLSWTSSWPALSYFQLAQDTEDPITPVTSLSSLGIFAQNCPNIRHIHLPVNASTVPSLDVTHDYPNRLRDITWIAGHSPINSCDVMDIASYLAIVLPGIHCVSGNQAPWNRVNNMVKVCAKVGRHFEKQMKR